MRPSFVSVVLALILAAVACGSESDNHGSIPPLPARNDLAFGTAGNVLLADEANLGGDASVDYLWVGFDSRAEWEAFLSLQIQVPRPWICGDVVPSPDRPLHFYLISTRTRRAQPTRSPKRCRCRSTF